MRDFANHGSRAAAFAAAALIMFACSLPAFANRAQSGDPRRLVDETIETLRARIIGDEARVRSDPVHAMGIVRDTVEPHIDIELAGRLVLGRHWHEASEAQRAAFVDGLRRLLLRIFALHAGDYTDAEISYAETEFSGDRRERARVRTQVLRSGKPAVTVDYRLHRKDGEWKVYDVAIFGVSIVKTYRLTIDADVRKHGLDGVIDQINAMMPLGVAPRTADEVRG